MPANTSAEEAGLAPAISAHRGGGELAAAGTYAAYRSAVELGADYAEFDVRQTRDRVLVGFHPARTGRVPAGRARGRPRLGPRVGDLTYPQLCRAAGYEVPRVSELARLLAGRAGAHVDLKEAGPAAAAVAEILSALSPADVVVTTRDAAVVRALSRLVPAGLTIGGDAAQAARFAVGRVWPPRVSRLDAACSAGATWAVMHRRTATPALIDRARVRGLKIMVWTVNGNLDLGRWVPGRLADVVVTDQPARAIRLRDQ